jgi:hypothetical protein
MAITNQERVGKALDLLRTEFAPFVAREQPASMKPRSSERGMRRVLRTRVLDVEGGFNEAAFF